MSTCNTANLKPITHKTILPFDIGIENFTAVYSSKYKCQVVHLPQHLHLKKGWGLLALLQPGYYHPYSSSYILFTTPCRFITITTTTHFQTSILHHYIIVTCYSMMPLWPTLQAPKPDYGHIVNKSENSSTLLFTYIFTLSVCAVCHTLPFLITSPSLCSTEYIHIITKPRLGMRHIAFQSPHHFQFFKVTDMLYDEIFSIIIIL